MKKSYIKLVCLNVVLIILLLLNNFISNILNYKNLVFLLLISVVLFKLVLGVEKDNHRYTKDIVLNLLIILLGFFFIYYLSGLIIGFVRTTNYYSLDGFKNLIIPYILIIIIKEYLRYQMIIKADNDKKIIILIFITFLLFDISGAINIGDWTSGYQVFMFFSLTLLPAISKNVAAMYIANKVGYKPNILWILIFGLYGVLLPIVPKTGLYIGSMINFLLPVGIAYNVYSFYSKRRNEKPTREKKYRDFFAVPLLVVFILVMIYFTSGYFKYYSIAIATGSMIPNINKGDVVIVNKKFIKDKLKTGQIIAYKYENKVIVHRIAEIEKVDKEYYIYTKGDANNARDGYIVYENMLIGTVNYKVPFIGLPTVWLNEL